LRSRYNHLRTPDAHPEIKGGLLRLKHRVLVKKKKKIQRLDNEKEGGHIKPVGGVFNVGGVALLFWY
jgi:hypothetical protein